MTEFIVTPMTEYHIQSAVELEESCGLNSRGIDGYQKILAKPSAVLLVAIPISLIYIRITGIFSGEVVIDELQIDNLAVSESFRRKGIGEKLLNEAFMLASGLGAITATLEVRAENFEARTFYEKNGFKEVGFRKKYYSAPTDDAVLLLRRI